MDNDTLITLITEHWFTEPPNENGNPGSCPHMALGGKSAPAHARHDSVKSTSRTARERKGQLRRLRQKIVPFLFLLVLEISSSQSRRATVHRRKKVASGEQRRPNLSQCHSLRHVHSHNHDRCFLVYPPEKCNAPLTCKECAPRLMLVGDARCSGRKWSRFGGASAFTARSGSS